MCPVDPKPAPFTRADVVRDRAALTVLHQQTFANAVVSRYDRADGSWVIKDFGQCPWWFRQAIGTLMVRREWAAMSRLDGSFGLPRDVFLLDAFAICYRYAEGQALQQLRPGQLNADFFRQLERIVWRMHRRDVAHLDLRCRSNVLRDPDGHPRIVDFQSHVRLSRFPRGIRKLLRLTDYSGVYKQWCKRAAGSIDQRRLGILKGTNRWRRLWLLRGYRLMATKRADWRQYENNQLVGRRNP